MSLKLIIKFFFLIKKPQIVNLVSIIFEKLNTFTKYYCNTIAYM